MKFSKFLPVLAMSCLANMAYAVQVTISCTGGETEKQFCIDASHQWAKETNNTVKIVIPSNDTEERLALYQQLLVSKSTDIDVFDIDVIWPGILKNYLLDLNKYVPKSVQDAHFKPIINVARIDGKLLALPQYNDAGVLFYRKDLLEKYGFKAPETWQELTQQATVILEKEHAAGNTQLQGFVWQGKAYEGLTCDALEWIDSFHGGTIIDEHGNVTINNPKAIEALELAKSWVGTISPKGVLAHEEEDSRGIFQLGHAIFMRNWPYAWSEAQEKTSAIHDKIAVEALPKGGVDGKRTATMGSMYLGVSAFTAHPKEATSLLMYLAGPKMQKKRALEGAFAPTIVALYDDPDIQKAVPFFAMLKDSFANAVARPSSVTGDRYSEVSNAFYSTVYQIISNQVEVKPALVALEKRLKRILR